MSEMSLPMKLKLSETKNVHKFWYSSGKLRRNSQKSAGSISGAEVGPGTGAGSGVEVGPGTVADSGPEVGPGDELGSGAVVRSSSRVGSSTGVVSGA